MTYNRHSLRYVRYLFFILLSSSAVYLLKTVLEFRNEATLKNMIFYVPEKFSEDYTRQMVRSEFHSCIAQPSKKIFCNAEQRNKFQLSSANKSYSSFEKVQDLSINASNARSHKSTDRGTRRLHPVYATLVSFTRLCKMLNITAVLIEPSIIFCMLTQDSQRLLRKRGFDASSLIGAENVLTFGINEMDSTKLADADVTAKLLLTDFNYWSVETEKTINFQNVSPDSRGLKSHHFFIHQHTRIIIHTVVFYQRNNYFWHDGIIMLPNEVLNLTPAENLLYSKTEAIYERFLPVEVPAALLAEALYIPSDPRLFLHQIKNSQFLHCNMSNAVHFNQLLTSHRGDSNLRNSQKTFNHRANIALQEMKLQLYPELMTFWIMAGTMLGWYRQCGIIPYTTDMDFAAWAADIDDAEKLEKKFLNNANLKMFEIMGLPQEGLQYKFLCHGMKVDLFFCYDDGKNYWIAGHRPSEGYYFPYYYPKFTLCSADLLGHKVLVPCQTLEVIITEYGTDWAHPITEWNYETSSRNTGQKRHWSDKQKPLVFVSYS